MPSLLRILKATFSPTKPTSFWRTDTKLGGDHCNWLVLECQLRISWELSVIRPPTKTRDIRADGRDENLRHKKILPPTGELRPGTLLPDLRCGLCHSFVDVYTSIDYEKTRESD